MELEKYIVYETHNRLGIQHKDDYARYCYEQEIVPIRFTIIEATREGILELYRLFRYDKDGYMDELLYYLKDMVLTHYQN